jgi:ribosomal protein L29
MKLAILTVKELRSKKPAEVEAYIADLKKSQTELNHNISTNKENKTHQVGVIKKAIARALTIQNVAAGEEK